LVCSKRAFIVTDPPLFDLGMVHKVTDVLEPMGVHYKVRENGWIFGMGQAC
jgi:acetaldehyde dehydrogenase/alcohol dehydrogenase